MSDKITVEAPDAEVTFDRWLMRGDKIGVFRNHDLSSYNCGHTIFIPITPDEVEKLPVGKAHAPDGSHGLGWRYILDEIVSDKSRFDFVKPQPEVLTGKKTKRKRSCS